MICTKYQEEVSQRDKISYIGKVLYEVDYCLIMEGGRVH